MQACLGDQSHLTHDAHHISHRVIKKRFLEWSDGIVVLAESDVQHQTQED